MEENMSDDHSNHELADVDEVQAYIDGVELDEMKKVLSDLKDQSYRYVSDSGPVLAAHHNSWDNHILTLSTAALAFIFGVLPLSEWSYLWLGVFGSASFVLSIFFAMLCFLFADKTFETSASLHYFRKKLINATQDNVDMRDSINEVDFAGGEAVTESGLSDALSVDKKSLDLLNEYNEKVVGYDCVDSKNSNYATLLNQLKTWAFLAGLVVTSIFVFMSSY
ncbi:MAG: hypothetical protein QM484_04430 [Woeseiaceae bacterium]